jgi:membrane-bound lytic murein transglycosylase A
MISGLCARTNWDRLPGWSGDEMAQAFVAFRLSAAQHRIRPCADGAFGVPSSSLEPAFAGALALESLDDDGARAFFERHFVPHLIKAPGFVTAYYEPEVEASAVRTDRYTIPLHAPPADLVRITGENRPEGWPEGLEYGRAMDEALVPYHDRAAIETGALGPEAPVLAFVESKVDAFFIHVQGAARLVMPDGRIERITYAAKSGHPFTGPGRLLVEMGEIAQEEISMQAIRAWFARNPGRIAEILHRNRSYIFFRRVEVDDPHGGPIAAAKVQLTAGRSLAVDRRLHTFASPIFVSAPGLTSFGGEAFNRLMIAQDTGSAIVGPARGDLFAGSGTAAGEIAGAVRNDATFWLLVPRALAERAS